jgi:hypothetical protein
LKPFDPSAPIVVGTPPAITQRDTSRAEQVIEAAINLDRALTTNAFEMGDLFAEIIDGDYVHADHCEDLEEFVKKHNFELSAREFRYRATVSRVSKKLGITRAQQLKAKISKMKAVCELNPALEYTDPSTGKTENVGDIMRELINDAGNGKQLKAIREIVNRIKGVTEGEDSVLEWWNLPVFKSRKEFMEETVEMAVQLSGDSVNAEGEAVDISRATAVERIFAEARSGFALEQPEEQQGGTFEDENFVRVDGTDFEVGS